MKTIVVTGAAGLVGQNLIPRLKARGHRVVAIDKHPTNTARLAELHPDITVVEADLAEPGPWMDRFAGADAVVINHAQIGGLVQAEFERNNVTATSRILEALEAHAVPYAVHISSSVVNSEAEDFYVDTKTRQERMVDGLSTPHVVLRPTLMFGWFDRKHLGWLRRFMDRSPVFPIPGDGRYARQPLYAGDFAAIVASALESGITGTYDISGRTVVDYVDIIRAIKRITGARARIVHIPFGLFWGLLWLYARFDRNPPFTVHQLEALVIPETFPIIDWPQIFGVAETPLLQALEETFQDARYSHIVLDF
ncbi:MAG: NAD-dependent epimerase/dehydratase family protein [Phenylobacterium sp.]|uniref:NAD-dependent epimerase/dehydratase family protein n=1 Tax=Phenylobacterium sp. TaxID=1871053 RepID=UPI00391BCD8C